MEDWNKGGFANSDVCESRLDLSDGRSIARIISNDFSIESFVQEFEKPALPVIIDGILEEQEWKAKYTWTFKV